MVIGYRDRVPRHLLSDRPGALAIRAREHSQTVGSFPWRNNATTRGQEPAPQGGNLNGGPMNALREMGLCESCRLVDISTIAPLSLNSLASQSGGKKKNASVLWCSQWQRRRICHCGFKGTSLTTCTRSSLNVPGTPFGVGWARYFHLLQLGNASSRLDILLSTPNFLCPI